MPGNESKLFVVMRIFYHIRIGIATGFFILVKNRGKFLLVLWKISKFVHRSLSLQGGRTPFPGFPPYRYCKFCHFIGSLLDIGGRNCYAEKKDTEVSPMKKVKGKSTRPEARAWWRKNRLSCLILAAAVVLFFAVRAAAVSREPSQSRGEDYAEYERGVITDVLADNTETDEISDGGYRGEQLLLATVRTGQYKGETMQVSNFVGPLYGQPLQVGQSAVLLISTYADGTHTATVYEYNRAVGLAVIVGLFLLVTVAVGGKVGAKSLIALAVTLACLFYVLIPLLMKGSPTLVTVFLVCAYITVVTMVILGGVCRKTVCAALGTIAGTALALLFGLLAQGILHIDGLRLTDVEPLLQLRQTGTPLGLRGLLVAGVVISALGAVMDVAMSISSALTEVHAVAPGRSGRDLFRSGMNIGRDMVGTMTNTLILAFLGSGFSFILYLCSLGLNLRQLISSPYVATEVISGVASSVGVILAVPLTAAITAAIVTREKAVPAAAEKAAEGK